ncbi:MAG: WD40 repeat domain-containing protein [Spirochaetaceae bacterium]|nr:MAG: WD40 repeat domain-containing protein [Spirochaetaceae bacterium]
MPGVISRLSDADPIAFDIEGYVSATAWSREGVRLAVASADGPVACFNTQKGLREWSHPGHGLGTSSVTMADDGALTVTCGQDDRVLFHGATGSPVCAGRLPGWGERVRLSTDQRYAAVASKRAVLVFDMLELPSHTRADGDPEIPVEPAFVFDGHASTVTDIAWEPGTHRLAATAYGTLTIWRVGTTGPVRVFRWQGSSLVVRWSPDKRFLATGDQDSTVHFWFIKEGKDLQMWGFETKVLELSWDHSGRHLATGGGRMPTVWDCSGQKGPEKRRPIQLERHESHVRALAFGNRTQLLASGDADGRLVLWNPIGSESPVSERRLNSAITQVAFSPDDSMLAVGGDDGTVTLYRLEP